MLLYTKQEIDVHKARISCLKYLWYFFFPLIPANETFINLKCILSIYIVIYTSLDKFMDINLQLWISYTTPSSATAPPPTPHWCWHPPCHYCVSPYCNFFLFSQWFLFLFFFLQISLVGLGFSLCKMFFMFCFCISFPNNFLVFLTCE